MPYSLGLFKVNECFIKDENVAISRLNLLFYLAHPIRFRTALLYKLTAYLPRILTA